MPGLELETGAVCFPPRQTSGTLRESCAVGTEKGIGQCHKLFSGSLDSMQASKHPTLAVYLDLRVIFSLVWEFT